MHLNECIIRALFDVNGTFGTGQYINDSCVSWLLTKAHGIAHLNSNICYSDFICGFLTKLLNASWIRDRNIDPWFSEESLTEDKHDNLWTVSIFTKISM